MNLCACGCGREIPERFRRACLDTGCYMRLRRNGGPKPPNRCWNCNVRIRDNAPACSRCRYIRKTTNRLNLKAMADCLRPRDPYPVEVTSADRVLASPCEDEVRRKVEQGLEPTACPDCGGRAWLEPPCTVTPRGGITTVTRPVRCAACARAKRDGRDTVTLSSPAVARDCAPAEVAQSHCRHISSEHWRAGAPNIGPDREGSEHYGPVRGFRPVTVAMALGAAGLWRHGWMGRRAA